MVMSSNYLANTTNSPQWLRLAHRGYRTERNKYSTELWIVAQDGILPYA